MSVIKKRDKIDVVLLTRNSMRPCLIECVNSLYKSVPVNKLIVVDNNSTDGTIEFLRTFPDVKIFNDNGNRATARQIGIEKCETEWFMFLDSDVILKDDWFNKAVKYMADNSIGAIQGSTEQNIQTTIHDFEVAMRTIRKWFSGLTMKPFLEPEQRGFTGDILIRTNLVKDIKIPKYLHIFEDHYIKKWIENKGYEWFRAPDVRCIHYLENRKPKVSLQAGYIGYKIGYISFKKSLFAVILIVPKIFIATALTCNIKMAIWQMKFQLYSFIGVLQGKLTTAIDKEVYKVLKFKTGTRKEFLKEYKVI